MIAKIVIEDRLTLSTSEVDTPGRYLEAEPNRGEGVISAHFLDARADVVRGSRKEGRRYLAVWGGEEAGREYVLMPVKGWKCRR